MTNLWQKAVSVLLLVATGGVRKQARGEITKNNEFNSLLSFSAPESLYKPLGYEHLDSLFGNPPGDSISQTVYYADGEFCEPFIDPTWKGPFVLMVDYGNCSFVEKARNAQKVGASAMLISNNSCLGGSFDCSYLMEPDGASDDIRIPSMLMRNDDADRVKKNLSAGLSVTAELSWLPNPNYEVNYELWMNPYDDFAARFKPIAIALGTDSRIKFRPHLYIYNGTKSCTTNYTNPDCMRDCTNQGRYCADSAHCACDLDCPNQMTGARVVEESLLQFCIWEEYHKEDGVDERWWNYAQSFQRNFFCAAEERSYTSLDMHFDENVNLCMEFSGGLQDDGFRNMYLDRELKLWDSKASNVSQENRLSNPLLSVNGKFLEGMLTPQLAFESICAAFVEDFEPEVCRLCADTSDALECLEEDTEPPTQFPTDALPPTQESTITGSITDPPTIILFHAFNGIQPESETETPTCVPSLPLTSTTTSLATKSISFEVADSIELESEANRFVVIRGLLAVGMIVGLLGFFVVSKSNRSGDSIQQYRDMIGKSHGYTELNLDDNQGVELT